MQSVPKPDSSDRFDPASTPTAKRLITDFLNRFSLPATHCVAAPGRVNFIGEHLDYNDGFVLPMAIDRYVTIIGAIDATSNEAEFYSKELQSTLKIRLDQPLQPVADSWENYILGVVAGFAERGIVIPAFKAIIASDVPLGGGLSSSAAMEVAVATFIESVSNQQLEPWDKALLCQQAEHRFTGMPCGIMDQFSSVFGRSGSLLLLDCRSLEIQFIPIDNPALTVLVCNSEVKHALVAGEYAMRRQQCEAAASALGVQSLRDVSRSQLGKQKSQLSAIEFRRARHVVTEIERTLECANAITECDWNRVGDLMYQSHASLCDDFEVSCPELDLIVAIHRELGPQRGVWGARMTGGGFGGSTVALVETASVPAISAAIHTAYFRQTNIQPTIFGCHPAAGARNLQPQLTQS